MRLSLTACFVLGGQPFEAFFPSLSVCFFERERKIGVRPPRLLESLRKLQASPAAHISFYFPLKAVSLFFLSTLTDFPLLLLFFGVPVTILSFLA